MVYRMEIYVDGGCRGNGQPDAIGTAAAVFAGQYGGLEGFTKVLPQHPAPTNQRAEITAIIIALAHAIAKANGLDARNPRCVQWIYKWTQNGWTNAAGFEVANRDLVEQAVDLDGRLKELGTVRYTWIPRSENEVADRLCNEVMDNL
ncbi:Ribonuclease H [Lachnellula suecica]|uniref:ribonuclease H n=1 Tax=Lachnellula suecica TaxID=602035 RepID=A0A8T9CCB3_9HELO|nr:Ribonuclease H [Lachnellula suecica]